MRYLFCFLLLRMTLSAAVMVGPGGTGGAYTLNTSVVTNYNATNFASQTEVNAGTATDKTVSPATLAGVIANTNGWPSQGGYPFVLWNQWTDYGTDNYFMTNAPNALRNGNYGWNTTANGWTNSNNAFLSNGVGYYLLGIGFSSSIWSNRVGLFTANWIHMPTGTNTFQYLTPTLTNRWGMQVYGGFTNWTGLTNGTGGVVYSNGTAYNVTSRINATNQSWTKQQDAP